MTYFYVDPKDDTIDIEFSNGVVVEVNEPLDKVFIAYGSQVSDFPLGQMFLATAHGDTADAARMRAQLHQLFANPLNAMGVADNDFYLRPDGFKGGFSGLNPVPGGGHYTCSGWWECFFTTWTWAYDSYLYYEFGYPDWGPSDPDQWNYWHGQQCAGVGPAMQDTALIAVGAGAACAVTPLTGAALVACLAGLGETTRQSTNMGDFIVNCNSSYVPH